MWLSKESVSGVGLADQSRAAAYWSRRLDLVLRGGVAVVVVGKVGSVELGRAGQVIEG